MTPLRSVQRLRQGFRYNEGHGKRLLPTSQRILLLGCPRDVAGLTGGSVIRGLQCSWC